MPAARRGCGIGVSLCGSRTPPPSRGAPPETPGQGLEPQIRAPEARVLPITPSRNAAASVVRTGRLTALCGRLLRPVAVEPPVGALRPHEVVVGALFDDPALVEHDDAAGLADGR